MESKLAEYGQVTVTRPPEPRVPAELFALAYVRNNLAGWDEVPDEALPIPQPLIEFAAYAIFDQRGRIHGFHFDDWYSARREICSLFRELLAYLRMSPRDDITGSPSELSSPEAEQSKMVDESGCRGNKNITPAGVLGKNESPDREPEQRMGMSRFVTQHRGESPYDDKNSGGYRDRLAALSATERKKYEGQILAVLEATGEIIASARSIDVLRKQVSASPYRGLAWQRVPGPSPEGPIGLGDVEEKFERPGAADPR